MVRDYRTSEPSDYRTFGLSTLYKVANFHFALFIIIIIINIFFLGAHVSAVSLPLSPACTLRLTAVLI